jgi:hypothetical protein
VLSKVVEGFGEVAVEEGMVVADAVLEKEV